MLSKNVCTDLCLFRAREIRAHSRILRLERGVCDQKTWCSRNFAPKTRRPGASLRPDEHSSRPDSENKNYFETVFVSNSDEREQHDSR